MDYNTSLPHMIIPEYGRHIQTMIDHAVTIEDKEERNKIARAIITIMGQLNPHLRDVTDFKHKLWDHIFIMSDFKLDVDSPYPLPTRETFQTKPERVAYPSNKVRFKHYGRTVQDIITKAKEFEAGEEKDVLVEQIANLMKRSYLSWNRDTVEDEVILKQLNELSNGELKLAEGVSLRHVQAPARTTTNAKPAQNGRDNKRRNNPTNKDGAKQNNRNNNHRKQQSRPA
jgi:Domain of unknown function (DUF4290)